MKDSPLQVRLAGELEDAAIETLEHDYLLKEYEVLTTKVDKTVELYWQLGAFLIGAAISGLGLIGQSLFRVESERPAAFVVGTMGILIVLVLFRWNQASNRWNSYVTAFYVRLRELESQLGMRGNSYITVLDQIKKKSIDQKALDTLWEEIERGYPKVYSELSQVEKGEIPLTNVASRMRREAAAWKGFDELRTSRAWENKLAELSNYELLLLLIERRKLTKTAESEAYSQRSVREFRCDLVLLVAFGWVLLTSIAVWKGIAACNLLDPFQLSALNIQQCSKGLYADPLGCIGLIIILSVFLWWYQAKQTNPNRINSLLYMLAFVISFLLFAGLALNPLFTFNPSQGVLVWALAQGSPWIAPMLPMLVALLILAYMYVLGTFFLFRLQSWLGLRRDRSPSHPTH